MVSGICLGDAGGLSFETSQRFYDSGMGHMVSVSGLHTSSVGGLLIGLFLLLKASKRYAKLCSIGLVWAFVLVAGAPYSAMRAAIMFTVFALGTVFIRLPDMLNTLGTAVLMILLLSPFAAGDIGFLASVSSCLGIILLTPHITPLLLSFLPKSWRPRKLCGWIAAGLGVTLGASFASIPCSLLGFYTLSVVAPITNLVGVPLADGVLLLGLFSALLHLLPGFTLISQLMLGVAGLLAKGLILLARWFGGLRVSVIPFATLWCFLGFLVAFLGGLALYRFRRQMSRWVKNALTAALAAVMLLSSLLPAYPKRVYEIMVINETYGTTVAIVGPRETVVIGCDVPYRMSTALGSRGIRHIDYLVLPNEQSYEQNLKNTMNYFTVDTVMTCAQTSSKGLLAGLSGYRTLSFQETLVLDGIAVTALEDFTAFSISVNGRRFLYAHGVIPEEDGYEYAVYHPGLSIRDRDAQLVWQGQTMVMDSWMVFRISPKKVTLYEPRFVYG